MEKSRKIFTENRKLNPWSGWEVERFKDIQFGTNRFPVTYLPYSEDGQSNVQMAFWMIKVCFVLNFHLISYHNFTLFFIMIKTEFSIVCQIDYSIIAAILNVFPLSASCKLNRCQWFFINMIMLVYAKCKRGKWKETIYETKVAIKNILLL